MSRIFRLKRGQTVLAVIDMQEGFRPTMRDFAQVAERIAVAVRAARILHIPCVVTEQYPRGLKHTAGEIVEALQPQAVQEELQRAEGGSVATTVIPGVIEKLTFSACACNDFMGELSRLNARQVLVCGIEAHICVAQTTLDLLERNYEVHLLTDCITSRHPESKVTAFHRLTQAGAVPSTLEMALFELMGTAGTPEFKAVQQLIK